MDQVARLSGVVLTPLQEFVATEGSVLHALRHTDGSYHGFQEAYFATIKPGQVKAWKRHKRMTLNLVVPVGRVRFIVWCETNGIRHYQDVTLSRDSYYRLTVQPLLWIGFQCISTTESLVLNVSNLVHDPSELERLTLSQVPFPFESVF